MAASLFERRPPFVTANAKASGLQKWTDKIYAILRNVILFSE
jgi:hypothetical protein